MRTCRRAARAGGTSSWPHWHQHTYRDLKAVLCVVIRDEENASIAQEDVQWEILGLERVGKVND